MSLDEIEEILGAMDDEDVDLLVRDAEHQITISSTCIRIPRLNVDIYEGVYYNYDEDIQDYVPDFDMYIFKELGKDSVIYDEGYSTLSASILNFGNMKGVVVNFEELSCKLIYK